MSRRRELLVALRAGLPETVERPQAPETPMAINVHSVAEGQQFAPGNTVLMPFDEAAKAWSANNAGKEAWENYLLEVEPQLTKGAYEALCLVPPLEREVLVLHDRAGPRLVSERRDVSEVETEIAFLKEKLSAMSVEELRELAADVANADQT
jgi:hypothetical protein